MALNKKPAFENEPTTSSNSGEAATVEREAPAVQGGTGDQFNEAAAAASASTAIATAKSTAVATAEAAQRAKEFTKEVDAMRGASDFSYGNYAVYKGNNGEIAQSGGGDDSLGRWAKVRMLAWDDHFEVSPGEQDKSSKDFVAYSKDGVTIDSVIGEEQRSWAGKPVKDYVAYLRDDTKDGEGFENADVRRFIDISCAVLGADNADAEGVNKVVQITLSQSSIPAFSKYQEDLKNNARCAAMGLPGFQVPEDPFTFYFIREVASKGNNKWTKLKIESTLPNKL